MDFSNFPKKIRIVEVGPRDGLQNEKQVIKTEDKAQFIKELAEAGHQTVEVSSFVRPDRVPQMADAKELYPMVQGLIEKGVDLPCLVPNLRGLETAKELGVKEVAVFTASSDTFNQKNINATISQSFERIEPVIEEALNVGMKVRGYLSTAFGCPYEGHVDPKKVKEVACRLEALGCYEISLGDTVGTGSPLSVKQTLDLILEDISVDKLALHFHDTRGTALANILTGLSMGVHVFDASAGGLGGCPYAKGATGNVATEDLVYLCETLGIDTGVDLKKLAHASEKILKLLGKETTSKFLKAFHNGDYNLFIPKP